MKTFAYAISLSAILSGIFLGIMNITLTTPVILEAEKFENAGHSHQSATGEESPLFERNLMTFAGTITIAFVTAFFIGLFLSAFKRYNLLTGVIFGGIAFLIIYFIPSLGLPPNPPGVEMLDEPSERQAWWFYSVFMSTLGFMVCYWFWKKKPLPFLIVGALFLLLAASIPFYDGIPNSIATSLVPQNLIEEFRLKSFLSAFSFWIFSGASSAFFLAKLSRKEENAY